MPKLISRQVALEKGLPRYFTGNPCQRGHVAERYTQGCSCVACLQENLANLDPRHRKLKHRERNLKERYGLTIKEFIQRVTEQASRCAICRNLSKKLVVDHCHTQNRVRELLCSRCNTLLGLAEDSIEILHAASEYIEKHS